MDNLPKIYISPINKPILDAIINHNENIGLIFSHRQFNNINGYVKKEIIEHALKFGKILERDHFCLNEYDKSKIEYDANKFDIIHIDPWYLNGYNLHSTEQWINDFLSFNKSIKFEFGTEDFIKKVSLIEYKIALNKLSHYLKSFVYLVCQGGSVVFNLSNIKPIDIEKTKEFIALGKKHGLKIKRHNCDFHTDEELSLLVKLGVDAFNFAPEFTYISNKVILSNMNEKDQLYFYEKIKTEAPWERWIDDISNKENALLSCLHYLDNDPLMYSYLIKFEKEIEHKVSERLTQICQIIY